MNTNRVLRARRRVALQPRNEGLGVPNLGPDPGRVFLDCRHQRAPFLTRPQREWIALPDQRRVKRLQVALHRAAHLSRCAGEAVASGVRDDAQAVSHGHDLSQAHLELKVEPGVRHRAQRRQQLVDPRMRDTIDRLIGRGSNGVHGAILGPRPSNGIVPIRARTGGVFHGARPKRRYCRQRCREANRP